MLDIHAVKFYKSIRGGVAVARIKNLGVQKGWEQGWYGHTHKKTKTKTNKQKTNKQKTNKQTKTTTNKKTQKQIFKNETKT